MKGLDAVDVVLTFKELEQIFAAVGLNLVEMLEDESGHSSRAGRIYARTGGVSQAVKATLECLRPGRKIELKAMQANGVAQCRQLLEDALNGKIEANFYEEMGCKGGRVGDPRR